MSWNHRIIKKEDNGQTSYQIYEVYYDIEGEVGWTELPVEPYGESIEELARDLKHFKEALSQPVLEIVGDKLFEVKSGNPVVAKPRI